MTMHRTSSSAIVSPIKYTKVLILGKEHNRDSVHEALTQRKDTTTLVIGDGENPITPDKISRELNNQRNDIDPDAVFSVQIHGMNTRGKRKGVYGAHNINGEENTEEIIKAIHDFSQSFLLDTGVQSKLTKIILDSCYAGTAQKIALPNNTLLFACGTRYHPSILNFHLAIKNLNLLQQSMEKFACSLIEEGETCYIIKKEKEEKKQEVKKIRRPKTENDFRKLDKYYQEQWGIFREQVPVSTQKLSLSGFDIKKALGNGFLNTAYKGKLLQLYLYLKKAINIDYTDKTGQTALHYAAYCGHVDVIVKLLRGLKPEDEVTFINQKDKTGQTALHLAAYYGHTEIVDELLRGLKPEDEVTFINQQNKNGQTALYGAAYCGHIDVIVKLLEGLTAKQKIAVINQKDQNGYTALHSAAYYGHIEIVDEFNKAIGRI